MTGNQSPVADMKDNLRTGNLVVTHGCSALVFIHIGSEENAFRRRKLTTGLGEELFPDFGSFAGAITDFVGFAGGGIAYGTKRKSENGEQD